MMKSEAPAVLESMGLPALALTSLPISMNFDQVMSVRSSMVYPACSRKSVRQAPIEVPASKGRP